MGKQGRPTYKKFDSQEIDNREHDTSLGLKKIMPYESDGTNAIASQTKQIDTKVRTSGTYIYIGKAPIGTAIGAAGWQVKRIDTTSVVDTSWADGNANFDNIFSNYLTLTYP